jgi:hypothetical protein
VILDRKHYKWAWGVTLITAVTSVHYLSYSGEAVNGPSGGSVEGVLYGVFSLGLILFAASLSLRRQVVSWRIGSADFWLRAHIWMSLLSVPMVLFHSGFQMGGWVTTVIMLLYWAIIASGIFGLALQQFLPERMTLQCPMEFVYELIEERLEDIRTEARMRVELALGAPLKPAGVEPPPKEDTLALPILEFFRQQVEPYLAGAGGPLDRKMMEKVPFQRLKTALPPNFHDTVDRLMDLCEERRQLLMQMNIHHWLHGWLLVHVPLSMLMVVVVLVHAIQALRF